MVPRSVVEDELRSKHVMAPFHADHASVAESLPLHTEQQVTGAEADHRSHYAAGASTTACQIVNA